MLMLINMHYGKEMVKGPRMLKGACAICSFIWYTYIIAYQAIIMHFDLPTKNANSFIVHYHIVKMSNFKCKLHIV